MPLIYTTYKAPWYFKNGHLQTVYGSTFRKISQPKYQREQLDTPDGDFLFLDWIKNNNKKLAIITHGMCGSSNETHVKGLVNALSAIHYDVLALNFRGSNDIPNRTWKTYHSGETDDLRFVINEILCRNEYEAIVLTGYSLGGNIILKYLGEQSDQISPLIKRAAVMSVPCDLDGCDLALQKGINKLYLWKFQKDLHKLLKNKVLQYPDKFSYEAFKKAFSLGDYANVYIAPAFGFKDADDYHTKSSSLQYLHKIKIPTLLLQAKDDAFLSASCYPTDIAEKSPYLTLEISQNGGHVGFTRFDKDKYSWADLRLRAFLDGKV